MRETAIIAGAPLRDGRSAYECGEDAPRALLSAG
jgi:hypothetical protein